LSRGDPDTSGAADGIIKPGMAKGAGSVAAEWEGASALSHVRWEGVVRADYLLRERCPIAAIAVSTLSSTSYQNSIFEIGFCF
jgi:hypothetical protein